MQKVTKTKNKNGVNFFSDGEYLKKFDRKILFVYVHTSSYFYTHAPLL